MPDTISKVVSPLAALGLGLKVDIDALPASLQAALAAGDVDLNSPATTKGHGQRNDTHASWNHLCVVSLHSRQLVCTGNRTSSRRVAQSRSECRRDCSAISVPCNLDGAARNSKIVGTRTL
jgi:hypothetical protein